MRYVNFVQKHVTTAQKNVVSTNMNIVSNVPKHAAVVLKNVEKWLPSPHGDWSKVAIKIKKEKPARLILRVFG